MKQRLLIKRSLTWPRKTWKQISSCAQTPKVKPLQIFNATYALFSYMNRWSAIDVSRYTAKLASMIGCNRGRLTVPFALKTSLHRLWTTSWKESCTRLCSKGALKTDVLKIKLHFHMNKWSTTSSRLALKQMWDVPCNVTQPLAKVNGSNILWLSVRTLNSSAHRAVRPISDHSFRHTTALKTLKIFK